MDLLELLAAGRVDEFNERRGRRGVLDLFGADLARVRAPGADLSGANLEKADLTEADFSDGVFVKANLSGADLSDARLDNAMGIRMSLREAWLGGASLVEADLSAADLTEAEAPGARFRSATLRGARLKRADLGKADLAGADLAEARLAKAVLAGADLSQAILQEADLAGADLTGARLVGADLSRARLAGADLTGADLTGANLSHADLTGATLTGATLTETTLRRADLTDAILEGADLSGADTTEAQLDAEAGAPADAAPPEVIFVEEPLVAATARRVAVAWENPAPGGGSRLCVAVGHATEAQLAPVRVVPLPADLVVARALVARNDGGFLLACLVQRPGGVVASAWRVDEDGGLHPALSARLPYTPAARPVLTAEGPDVLLHGISREGPALQVHRVTEAGLEPVHASRMPTVRGFVSDREPVVLSKGGTLVVLGPRGPGQPMRVSGDFPGRRCAVVAEGEDLVLAWTSRAGKGLRLARVRPGRAEDPVVSLPKQDIGTVDLARTADGATWLAWIVEPPVPDEPAVAWARRLPDGAPLPLNESDGIDASELRLVAGGGRALAAVTTLDGQLVLYVLGDRGARAAWTLGQA